MRKERGEKNHLENEGDSKLKQTLKMKQYKSSEDKNHGK